MWDAHHTDNYGCNGLRKKDDHTTYLHFSLGYGTFVFRMWLANCLLQRCREVRVTNHLDNRCIGDTRVSIRVR